METLVEKAKKIFENYHRFDDGLILSFEYFYAPNEALAVQMIFYAKNHSLEGNVWRKVRVIVKDVQELCVKIKGNQFNSISLGVKLLNFGDLWCIDVDGNYKMAGDPDSLDEVRQDGECYIVGRYLEVFEIDDTISEILEK